MPKKLNPLFTFDRKIVLTLKKDAPVIIGVDEAGRGPLAGPVVACAVLLSGGFHETRVNDSKKLNPRTRFLLCRKIKKNALWALGLATSETIDSINILQATHKAMREAIQNLLSQRPGLVPDLVLIDGLPVPRIDFPQRAIVGGDGKSAAIASASIIAKVSRDHMMKEYHRIYPQYGFARHKGYGTRLHQKRLKKFGPCPIHRKSFWPVGALLLHGLQPASL